jgi:hypothetical protein
MPRMTKKQKEEKVRLIPLYERIERLLENNDNVKLGELTHMRVMDRIYKSKAVKDVLLSIEWFLKYYGEVYEAQIVHISTKCYLAIWDINKNYCAAYSVSSGKVWMYPDDIKMFVHALQHEGVYDPEIHYFMENQERLCVNDIEIRKPKKGDN